MEYSRKVRYHYGTTQSRIYTWPEAHPHSRDSPTDTLFVTPSQHHINNANLMRNGADFSISINTAQEFDGSDSGARPDEAVSWGKIRPEANPVKIYADATILFPLLLAQTLKPNLEP